MQEKLKEFVEKLLNEMPIDPLSSDMEDFAQAVADFTEKRVLEGIKSLYFKWLEEPEPTLDFMALIDQRLAALEKKGEKDGMA